VDAEPGRFELPARLEAFEIRQSLSGGRTRPMLAAAIDDDGLEHLVVLKIRRPASRDGHFGPTSLACELVCAAIARLLGLRVPDYFVVNVSDALARAVSADRRQMLLENRGENFGSEYLAGMQLWHPDARPNTPDAVAALEEALSFDAAVINGDRKKEKPNLLWRGDDLALIDHSLALPLHLWPPDLVASSPLFPDEEIRAHAAFDALCGQARSFSALYASWARQVTRAELDRLQEAVPAAWEHEPGTVDRIVGFLAARAERLDAQAAELRRIVR